MANDTVGDPMVKNLADFLELLTITRTRVRASGEEPNEIPDDLKALVLKLISE